RGQTILDTRADRADQGGAAARPDRWRHGLDRKRRLADRWSRAPRVRGRSPGRDRPHRISAAALFHEPPRARLFARAIAGPGLGRQRVRRGTHGGRAHPAPAQNAGTVRAGCTDPDRAWHGLSILHPTMNTDRSRARRLATQLRDLRTVACALSDALVLLDPDGCMRWCNPAAGQLLGIVWPRDRGLAVAERFGDGEAGTWLRTGQGDADDIASPVDPTVRLQLSLIPYGGHRRLLIARDISRVTRLEQVRRDFVANVSHELRTPLTVIHGYLELLDPEDVPTLAPVLNEMRAQSQRMRQIVEDLLELSRLEMQQHLA